MLTFLDSANLGPADNVMNLGLTFAATYLTNSGDLFPVSLGHHIDCQEGVFEDVL